MALSLVKILDIPWEQARTNLRQNLESIQVAFNQFIVKDKQEDLVLAQNNILTDQSIITLDASLGTVFRLAANGDRLLSVPLNPTSGQRLLLQHFAGGGSNRTLSLVTSSKGFRYNTTFPALTATTAGTTDYIEFIYNNVDGFWDILNVVKG